MSKKIRWTRELVLQKIREYHAQGVELKSNSIRKVDNKLFDAARRRFSSWGEAVEMAGFEYDHQEWLPRNVITIEGDTKKIIVTKRDGSKHIVLVDSYLSLPSKIGIPMEHDHAQVSFEGQSMPLHIYIYGQAREGYAVSHIDGNQLNNKISNLREIPLGKQILNIKHKGYHLNKKTGKYLAFIKVDGNKKYLGSFDTPEEASLEYKRAKVKYHGKYASVDYIEEIKCDVANLNSKMFN
ncbi:HNH endonuclease [Bacillus thuringiensis]|uniref:HNH endonuclease n=1 Tax=Bacillus thuringiensis TaxID=1428 RepID=UPI00159C8433|nr:HNH endonuclease [Bacillus thuringiensis]